MKPAARRNEPRFDRDVEWGKQGELQIDDFLEWIATKNGRVEVKRKGYLDHRFYVETHHDPGRRGVYQPSGINVSTSVLWCFVIGDSGVHVAVPADLLRAMLADPSSKPCEETRGSCPTRGILIDFCVLLYRLKKQREREQKHPSE